MFERYTEKARRVIFFARYEASQFGAPAIEPEHLLLGVLREDKALVSRFFQHGQVSHEKIRAEVERRTPPREKFATSVELPLTITLLACWLTHTRRVIVFSIVTSAQNICCSACSAKTARWLPNFFTSAACD